MDPQPTYRNKISADEIMRSALPYGEQLGASPSKTIKKFLRQTGPKALERSLRAAKTMARIGLWSLLWIKGKCQHRDLDFMR